MTIKYYQKTGDSRQAIYEVDDVKMTWKLVKCSGDAVPDLRGRYVPGNFSKDAGFVQVAKPV